MSYRVYNGFIGLPSRYDPGGGHQYHVDTGRRSPRWVSKDITNSRHGMESPRPFSLSELERNIEAASHLESEFLNGQWRDYNRSTISPRQADRSRSVSPLRGIHSLECSSKLPVGTDYIRNVSSPPLSRRNSLSRLPTWSPDESILESSLNRRGWSGSEVDLRASLTKSAQKRADLVQRLRDAQGQLEGQSDELRKRDKELEFSRAKIELLAVKQKQLESSISQLEKEKGWLEVSRYEDKKQRGELQDRIVNLEMEVMKAKSSLENLNYANLFGTQKNTTGNNEMIQDLKTARENLLYFRNRVKVLEAEKNQAVEELQTLREEKELLSSKVMRLEEKVSDLDVRLKLAQTDRERFLQEKLSLHRRTQELLLELERAKMGREGFNDQVSDLHIELVSAKAQANRQDQEKVQMKEELVLLKQVNEKLTVDLGQTQEKLQICMSELHQIQAEHKISKNLTAALEAERAQLLAEKQLLESSMENEEDSESVLELRSSHEQLQEERDTLRTHCNTLEVALEQAHEQMGSQIQEQQQVAMYWKERWQETALNLKNTEERLEHASSQCQKAADQNTGLLEDRGILQLDTEELSELRMTVSSLQEEIHLLQKQLKEQAESHQMQHLQSHLLSTRMQNGSVLRIELDACKQQLELQRSRREALQERIGELEAKLRTEEKNGKNHPHNLDSHSLLFQSERTSSAELRSQIENLKQELEKEREAVMQKEELIFTLREEVEELKHKKPGDIKASLEEVDSDLVEVRKELQKVWDMLKTKGTELEEQYQELKSARSQYKECSAENVRLEQLVASLQKQLEGSEETVRHLQQKREMEKTEMDIERSSLELKLAEMHGQTDTASSTAVHQPPRTGPRRWSPVGAQAADGSQKCARCDAFLLQLDKTIKGCQGCNVELEEEKTQMLSSLHQLQGILKDSSKQTKVNEQVAQILQADNESLKKQYRSVTEQLKGLFKEKINLTKAYNKLPKEEKPEENWAEKFKMVENVQSSIEDQEKRQEELGKERDRLQEDLIKTHNNDIRSLQRQLEEQSNKISSMTSEIKMLRERNDSLMKAKLRFQQQVQQIRSTSQLGHGSNRTDPTVPRLSGSPIDTSPNNGAEHTLSGSQESLVPSAGTRASLQSPSEGSWTASSQNSRPGTPIHSSVTPPASPMRLNPPGTMVKSWKRSTEGSPLSPRSQADSECTNDTQGSHTPRVSALLSPRPYNAQKANQIFKFGDN
ncbi:myosin-2 heavy chain-like isoform X2 [Pelobates fuscus]|uniref:myosin-2 heavy chain-like isoform X2 n=1 Tax=Pelobates fuscus TaxID=191477 RepID=UPI002FE48C2C